MSKIEWTDKTWNPIIGCSKVSPACDNCYAEKMAARLAHNPKAPAEYSLVVDHKGKWLDDPVDVDSALFKPFSWKKPCRVFVCSMSDLFHESISYDRIDKVFAVMAATPHITYQILTKRADRMRDYVTSLHKRAFDNGFFARARRGCPYNDDRVSVMLQQHLYPDHSIPTTRQYPLNNVWLGVTVENQEQADIRIPALLEIPDVVRYVSVEPMLGPVNLDFVECTPFLDGEGADYYTALRGFSHWRGGDFGINGPALNWVICGGETGSKARPMHPEWVATILEQCRIAEVPFLFKQWGEWKPAERDGDLVLIPDKPKPPECRFITEEGEKAPEGDYETAVLKLGKKAAGREIESRTWDEFPTGYGGEVDND